MSKSLLVSRWASTKPAISITIVAARIKELKDALEA
jgi:hypothetical protein